MFGIWKKSDQDISELKDQHESHIDALHEEIENLKEQLATQQVYHTKEVHDLRKLIGARSMKKLTKQFAKMTRNEAEEYAKNTIDEKWDTLRKHLEKQVKQWRTAAAALSIVALGLAGFIAGML